MSEPSSSSQPSSEVASLSDAQFIQAMRQQQEVTQRLLREQSAGIDRLQALVMENFRDLSGQVVRLEHKVEQQKVTIERLEKFLLDARERELRRQESQWERELAALKMRREQNSEYIKNLEALEVLLDGSSFSPSDYPPPPTNLQQLSCASARSAAASRNIAATRPAAGLATAASGRGRRARSSASTTPRRTQQSATVAAAADQVVDAATGPSAGER